MKKSRIVILAASSCLLFCSIACAQTLGYKGVPFGATKEELLTRFPGLSCSPPAPALSFMGTENCTPNLSSNVNDILPLATYGGQTVHSVNFGMVDGKFGRFSLVFSSFRYEAIRDAVSAALPSGKESSRSVQLRSGAKLESRSLLVSSPDGSISVHENLTRADEGQITGYSKEFNAYLDRLQQNGVKAGSKDI